MKRIETLLIANRGEIACRIARTARALGITPVGVHSQADAAAAHVREIGRSVCIGPGPASESYLRIDAVLDAARELGADAVHPGYGFLAENAQFARAVEAAGLTFVGPTAHTLERFGDKASAKEAAVAAGVPVVSGTQGALSDPEEIAARVRESGLPVLLKAVGGGGGRGQRLVENEATLADDIEAALREAKSAFGSEGLIVERFVPEARHVEVQIVGDGQGHVIHLHERDCTLQRRRQKVIEEAPAWGLPAGLAERVAADAVRLCESLSYRSLGTVEFLVSGDEHFFLEVNPRIQVEHPVTEAVTGLDLVALQLRIAEGGGIGLTQEDVRVVGHAVEARLYAEDPQNAFAPSTGQLTALTLPAGVAGALRIDSGVAEGDSVSPFYDPMIAKLVAYGPDRETALARLSHALDHTAVAGVETNRAFLAALARDDAVARMAVHTRWIDEHLDRLLATTHEAGEPLWSALAAVLYLAHGRVENGPDPWSNRDTFTGWRLGLGGAPEEASQRITLSRPGVAGHEVRVGPVRPGGRYSVYGADADDADAPIEIAVEEIAPGRWRVVHGRRTEVVGAALSDGRVEIDAPHGRLLFEAVPPLAFAGGETTADRIVAAPLTGLIVKVLAAEGDPIEVGDTVAILESMKLEIAIKAAASGHVAAIAVKDGAMVDRGQAIAEIAPKEGDTT